MKMLSGGGRIYKFRDFEEGQRGLACAWTYHGVGFEHTWDNRVIAVARNGPAWNAGIRIGDILLRYMETEEAYEFDMLKQGKTEVHYKIFKTDICQDEYLQ